MQIAVLTMSTLSLVASAATLAVVLVGAKRVEQQVESVKTETNRRIRHMKKALAELDF